MQDETLYIGWRINAVLVRSEDDPKGTIQVLKDIGFTTRAARHIVSKASRQLAAQHVKEIVA